MSTLNVRLDKRMEGLAVQSAEDAGKLMEERGLSPEAICLTAIAIALDALDKVPLDVRPILHGFLVREMVMAEKAPRSAN